MLKQFFEANDEMLDLWAPLKTSQKTYKMR